MYRMEWLVKEILKIDPLKVLNKCQTLVNIAPCPPLAKLEPQSSNIPELLSPSKFEQSDRFLSRSRFHAIPWAQVEKGKN